MIEKRAWRSEGIEANNLKAFVVLGSRLTICLESAVKAGDCRLLQGCGLFGLAPDGSRSVLLSI